MNVLCMGETLLRYSTPKGHRLNEMMFDVHIGGSETNIAVNLAQYGFQVSLLTKLPDHAIGDAVISFLRSFGVSTSSILRNDMRMGSYFLENGSGCRASQVIYDRKYSAMTSFTLDDIDLEAMFKNIDVFIVSGITVALSQDIKKAVLAMLQYCRKHAITVVYDSNYRAKLWSLQEAGQALKEILPYVDILSAGYLDAKNLLGLETKKVKYVDCLEDYYNQLSSAYPNLRYIVSTKRKIISTSVNELTGYIYDNKIHVSKTYYIDDIVDRVGGGDAFLSGVLYGLLNNQDVNYSLEFGCCASVLKHTIYGDANRFSVSEIESFLCQGISKIDR